MECNISEADFNYVCRFCLDIASEQNPQFPLFLHEGRYGRYAKSGNESLPEIINTCLGMKASLVSCKVNHVF